MLNVPMMVGYQKKNLGGMARDEDEDELENRQYDYKQD